MFSTENNAADLKPNLNNLKKFIEESIDISATFKKTEFLNDIFKEVQEFEENYNEKDTDGKKACLGELIELILDDDGSKAEFVDRNLDIEIITTNNKFDKLGAGRYGKVYAFQFDNNSFALKIQVKNTDEQKNETFLFETINKFTVEDHFDNLAFYYDSFDLSFIVTILDDIKKNIELHCIILPQAENNACDLNFDTKENHIKNQITKYYLMKEVYESFFKQIFISLFIFHKVFEGPHLDSKIDNFFVFGDVSYKNENDGKVYPFHEFEHKKKSENMKKKIKTENKNKDFYFKNCNFEICLFDFGLSNTDDPRDYYPNDYQGSYSIECARSENWFFFDYFNLILSLNFAESQNSTYPYFNNCKRKLKEKITEIYKRQLKSELKIDDKDVQAKNYSSEAIFIELYDVVEEYFNKS